MSVRIDKWLWAARFFRTRAKAKEAIDGGKVQVNGQRTKPAKEIAVGDTLRIRQGWDEKTVVVSELSDQRRSAELASRLYEETAESQAKREMASLQRKAAGQAVRSEGRPTKRDRRQIHKFRQDNPE